jgi:hypothetical protein
MGWSWAGALSGIDKMQAKALKEDELSNEREKSLLGLYLAKLEKQSTAKAGDKYRNAAQASLRLQKRISGADLAEEDLAFFNNIIEDPFAAEEVLNFIDSQATEYGMRVQLSDIPSMINIIQSPASTEDKIDYMSLITGADLSDSSKYYEIAQQLSSITTAPGRTVITDVKPSTRVSSKLEEDRNDLMLGIIGGQLVGRAKAFVNSSEADSSNPQVRKIQNAINLIESGNKESIQVGREILMEEYLTPENFMTDFVENFPDQFKGWENNYYLPPSLKAIQEPELPGNNNNVRVIPNATVLTQEMIDSNPSLKNVGAQPGDQFLQTTEGGKLYGPDGNPKQ